LLTVLTVFTDFVYKRKRSTTNGSLTKPIDFQEPKAEN